MSPPTLKGGLSLVLLAAALGLLTTCTDNREHPLSPEVVAPLYDVTPGNYTITGTITDPDGNNICDRFPEGSAYRIW